MAEEGPNQLCAVPVPKPRRHVIIESSNKTSYENVAIDLINKNININDENLQNNKTKTKLPNNKTFLTSGGGGGNGSSGGSGGNSITNDEYRNVITELNDLHSDKNKNVIKLEEINKLSNIYDDDENCKKPVPAPRRAAASKATTAAANPVNLTTTSINEEIYENSGERRNGDGNSSCSSSSSGISGDYCVMKVSTGAINKVHSPIRCAPELPEKKGTDRLKKNGQKSASYSFVDEPDCVGIEGTAPEKYNLKKSVSSSSLNSSQSGGSERTGGKFTTSSPG